MGTYVGPKTQIGPDDLQRYDSSGQWCAEEKRDGCWVEVRIDSSGTIVKLTSRVGKAFVGDTANGLLGLRTHLPNSVLVGELEAASEAATDRYRAVGFRRIHIFDAPMMGGLDLTSRDYATRRQVVEQFVPGKVEDVRKRLLVVRQVVSGFSEFYASILADGGEGLVLKKRGSLYRPVTKDGKIDAWVRCKAHSFVDYVVLRVGRSDGGADNLKVGLYVDGVLTECCTIKNLPRGLDLAALVGCVIECKGAEVMKSGALRHGHFVRLREDKDPQDCTLRSVC